MKKAFIFDDIVRPQKRNTEYVDWPAAGPRRKKSIYLRDVPHFSARGMKLIYGRGDHYPSKNDPALRKLFRWSENARTLICMIDMWQSNEGRIFVRFHTRRWRLDKWSFELHGLKLPEKWTRDDFFGGECVPETLRDRYEEWVTECLNNPE